jgi:type IV pilus assembly protein PilB
MGLEPFLLAATLETVVAQRLVRRVCPHCKSSYVPTEDLLMELGPDAKLLAGREVWFGKGCKECFHTGYLGRTAITEIMVMDDDLRGLVLENASTAKVRELARRRGMRTLRESGLSAVARGATTIEEIMRETAGII